MKGVQCYENFGGIALKTNVCFFFTLHAENVKGILDRQRRWKKRYVMKWKP